MYGELDFIFDKLKYYPHFDDLLSENKIKKSVIDPVKIAHHCFYPFIRYNKMWQPYRLSRSFASPPKKIRPISYAAREDAYIFMYYRQKLLIPYEKELAKRRIGDCCIAYRSIPLTEGSKKGKCNINFAKDAFDEVDKQGNCIAIALDIKGYFDNLDHQRIYKIWCDLLEVKKLSDDILLFLKILRGTAMLIKRSFMTV